MKYKAVIKNHKFLIISLAIFATAVLSWKIVSTFSVDTEDSSWDGTIATSFTSGTGTSENPYVISNASEYGYFKYLLESDDAILYADKTYVIKSSFNVGKHNVSINNEIPFSGTIDGQGNMIYRLSIDNSLINKLDGANIYNIQFSDINISVNKTMGVFADNIDNSKIENLILEGKMNSESQDESHVFGIATGISNSELKNIVINFDADSSKFITISDIVDNNNFENILARSGFTHSEKELNFTIDEFSYSDGKIVVSDSSKLQTDNYEIIIENGTFSIKSKANRDSGDLIDEGNTTPIIRSVKSAAISLHNSEIVSSDHAIYINDLISDYNYYIGLNYTKITNNTGVIPTGNDQQIYSNDNLATVYIRYSSADINNVDRYGSVSVSEDIRDYYYYKRYPVENGYITFDLIDNPWANRPANMVFNGWVTDYEDAVITLDTDVYKRAVRIPITDVNTPVSITFYTSWTTASLATTTNEISSKLKSQTMQELVGNYGDLTSYYIRDHIDYYDDYPTNVGPIYNTSGTRITASYCNNYYSGCDFVRRNTSNDYNPNTYYYTATPNGNNVTLTRVTPSKVSPVSYYNSGDVAAGLFVRVTSGSENIYSSNGEKLSSCSGTCYKLLQYSDGTLDDNTTYYYLPTRDTNIFAPSASSTNTSNISTSVPMTITALNNGNDNSNNRIIQLNNNWSISNDLRIEFITFYVNSSNIDVSSLGSGNKIIGNFNNLKIGRGLKKYTSYNTTYLTATSFAGGSSSQASSLTRYSTIVESGYYQNGSAVGYDSATTHKVLADVTLGSDYDRIDNNNENLIIYYCYAGTWASNLYSTSTSINSYELPAIYTTVKSGSFGLNKADYAAGIYVGGRNSGTHYALREILVEGGYIYNLIGGPSSSSERKSKNDIIINVKGGNIDLVLGGAGASDTVGNKILNITGGTINYGVLGGSNASEYSSNTTNPYGKIDGDTLLYIGGNVTVGTKNDKLFTISSGDVYGAGNGREGESTVGAVNNSHVIIGPNATIKGNVYGGGNNGAVGGNTAGVSTVVQEQDGGVYEDGTSDNNIRYYGEDPFNYIRFNNETYRILGLFNNIDTPSGSKSLVKVIKDTSSSNSQAWMNTNAYINPSGNNRDYANYFVRNDNSGTKSQIYTYLNTTFYNNLGSTYRNYIQSVNWSLGALNNANHNVNEFYVGERSNTQGSRYSMTNYTYNVGLVYPSDYGFATNDAACHSRNLSSFSQNNTCTTENWLSDVFTRDAWTMSSSTAYSNIYNNNNRTYNSYEVFYLTDGDIASDGVAYRSFGSYYSNQYAVYPSFYLKEDVTISGGSGSSSDPYVIGTSDNKLSDIIYELMHPTVNPEEPTNEHDDSEYMARTHIEIIGGTIEGAVYGAGNNNGAGNSDDESLALAKIVIDMTGGTVSKSIYGGANTKGTVYGDVSINILNGEIMGSVYGGGKGGHDDDNDGTYVTDNINVKIGDDSTTNLQIYGNVYGGSAFGTVNADTFDATETNYSTKVIVNAGTIIGSVFGGGQGDSSYTPNVVGNIDVIINGGDITNVFGGNDQAGSYEKMAIVQLNGGTIGSVYGGGNKSSVLNTHVNQDGATVTNIYGGSNTLGDVSTTDIKIRNGVTGNVYGGNNEGGTCSITNVLVEGDATISSSIYGGGNQVDTKTTNITLNSNSGTIPNVFGGGNSASVDTTNINQNGSTVTNIFGGSNSSGTVTESSVILNSGNTSQVYGGNNAGGNTLTTNITANGGTISKIFGGGNQASTDVSNITYNNGQATQVFGGGNNAGVTTTNIIVVGGNITELFGGSNNSGDVETVNVTINSGNLANVYGGGNLAKITGNTYVDTNGGIVTGNIYGGGNQGVVEGSTFVTITDTAIRGSAYAGGNGLTATVERNANISLDGYTVIGSPESSSPTSGCVFGGGNQAFTGTESDNTSISTVNIAGGTIYGNVYGGANTSVVYGNTLVNIGAGAIRDEPSLVKSDIHVYGHVFGGGEANASGSEIYDWFFISVTQGTHIDIDALNYNNFSIDGSFYGGGNASSASGDSYLNISNYGQRGTPKTNISIQRVTYVTIDNSSILLKGAIDRANDYDKELFAISRVDDFTIKNNTELYFETGSNLLSKFKSLDGDNSPASVTINEDTNAFTRTTDNRVYMYEGKNLNIAKDQQVSDYGEVIGMSFLGIYNYSNNGKVNTGMYSSTHSPGDTLDWSESFSKGSYVLGLHEKNHDIKVNGFYSYFMNEDTMINEVKYIKPTPEASRFYMWFIGENVIEYNVNLVASKYSTLGSVETSFLDFAKPNTTFSITGFDYTDLARGISLVYKGDIPRIAASENDANSKFGLSIESSNSGWLTPGSTDFLSTNSSGIIGRKSYEKDSTNAVPTLLFYLHHSKNITIEEDLGTVRISMLAVTKIDALKSEIKRLVVNVTMSTALFQTTEYEGAMAPGDKYELFASTATNITTKSKLSAYYGLYGSNKNLYKTGYHRALSSSFVLPAGTKITMIELVDGTNNYYYHVIDDNEVMQTIAEYNTEGECSYLLSEFVPMGTKGSSGYYNDADKNREYYDGTDSNEEFIFIVDFGDTEISSDKLNNTLLLEIRDANEESIISVLGMQHAQMTYNLYANKDAIINVTASLDDDPLYVGYNDVLNISANYMSTTQNGLSITDTQNFDKKLGLQIHLLDRNGHIVSGTDLVGTTIMNDDQKIQADINGFYRLTISETVGNVQKWLIFNAQSSLLPTGKYTMVIEAFPSVDGEYYEKVTPSTCEFDFDFISTSYGLKPVLNPESVILKAEEENEVAFKVNYSSLLNNPNIRLAMSRRKYDEIYSTEFEAVDLGEYFTNELLATDNQYEYMIFDSPTEENSMALSMISNQLTGTYRLEFRLYDNDTLIGEIYKYIIVR